MRNPNSLQGGAAAGHSRPARAAFTLLEVMITLVILAMILTMIYGVLLSTLKTRARIEEVMAPARVAPALAALVEADFQAVYLTSDNDTTACFVGKDNHAGQVGTDRVDFVATRMSWDAEKNVSRELTEVGYQVQENPDRSGFYRLYRRESPGVDDKPTTGGSLVPIYDLVRSLEVQYSDGQSWVDSWDSKEKKALPRAVKMTLKVAVERKAAEGTQPQYDDEPDVILYIPLPH